MDITKIKLPIAVIGVILAQAFGIIWYVAQLDSTVKDLDSSMAIIQEQATTVDVAVLQTDLENIKEQVFKLESIDVKEFDATSILDSIKAFDNRLDEIEKSQAIIENEMRTIMSDHMGFNDILKSLGKEGYGDTREYGNYEK